MNENQPPNEPNRGFFAGIRKSNLVRGDDRWLGGVSSAVVDRTGMDLTLVRGLFVVAGLFGIGFLAYGLAWLFLPDVRDGKIPAEEISRGQVDGLFIAAAAFVVIGFWAPFSIGNWTIGTWMLIPNGIGLLIVAIVVLVALAQNNSGGNSRPIEHTEPIEATHPQAGEAGGVGGTPPPAPAPTPASAAAPAPAPAQSKPKVNHRPSSAFIAAVLGIALIVTALVSVSAMGPRNWWVEAAGVGIVVLGLGIVVAGFLGKSSSVLSPLALATMLITLSASLGLLGKGPLVGDVSWHPAELTNAETTRALGVGSLYADFTEVPKGTSTHETNLRFGVGDATIVIPNDRHVVVTTTVGVGEVEIEDQPGAGPSGVFVGEDWWAFGEQFSDEPELRISVAGLVGNIYISSTSPTMIEVES